MKMLLWILLPLILLVVIFLAGPKPDKPVLEQSLPDLPSDPEALTAFVADREARETDVKQGCESLIVWSQDSLVKTEYAVVYLHGFSACRQECETLARDFAERYGCNLYLPRLQAHGKDRQEALLEMRADSLYASARDALAVGRALGDKVILMSTSTGGTLSLTLAANFPDLAGLILFSPNVRIRNITSSLLTYPWGLEMAQISEGGKYHSWEGDDYSTKYWNSRYRIEALVQLQLLVENTMKPETFARVESPVFLGYYYKDEENQDPTVSVPALLEMFEQLGTPPEKKRKMAFAEAGEHVICNPQLSGAYPEVQTAVYSFSEQILGLNTHSVKHSEAAE